MKISNVIGMGTFVDEMNPISSERLSEILTIALALGIKSFDTSHNYGFGESEIALARALQSSRTNDAWVQTKLGFPDIRFLNNRMLYSKSIKDRYDITDAEIRPLTNRQGHCIDRPFLEACMDVSLRKFGEFTFDRVLLHNPETQFKLGNRGQVLSRIENAFEFFEFIKGRGQIRGYGVATWAGLYTSPEDTSHISLEELVQIAKKVGGSRHNFKTVMMPVSIINKHAVNTKSQSLNGLLVTPLKAAKSLGLEIQVSSPLSQGHTQLDEGAVNFFKELKNDYDISKIFFTMWNPTHLTRNTKFLSNTIGL